MSSLLIIMPSIYLSTYRSEWLSSSLVEVRLTAEVLTRRGIATSTWIDLWSLSISPPTQCYSLTSSPITFSRLFSLQDGNPLPLFLDYPPSLSSIHWQSIVHLTVLWKEQEEELLTASQTTTWRIHDKRVCESERVSNWPDDPLLKLDDPPPPPPLLDLRGITGVDINRTSNNTRLSILQKICIKSHQ